MKKAMLALAATSLIALSACGTSDKVATSKAGDVTKDEFYDAMKKTQGENVLRTLVMEKVFTKNYKVDDKKVDEEFATFKKQYGDQFESVLKQYKTDEKTIKNSIRSKLAMEAAIAKTISDDDAKKNYRDKKVFAKHILVKDEEAAKKVKEELAQGKSFEEVAKAESQDTGSAQNGGDLGELKPGTLVKEFEDAAFKMKKDEVSEPVKSQFGYHIIKVTDVKESKPFNEEKETIKKELAESKSQDAAFMSEFVAKEMKKADVKVEDKDLKNIFDVQKAAAPQQ
ncbi:peptidylprolyl isomerase PrsA [Bacillus sp. DX1.1]|uniref:peptidylprolyl isomerase PrsA n=1 Tax=unclassified Bacillus (in: firmicutes) TaxID=185979 RepID=UPI002570B88A|nr:MULTISPECIES: peptidylprolyl isomerase PrsA [unclassified Bacillus (in: firmicutes)]MDM5153739.1 peptidylprolyl isomerase PrsA [Bacillus sp. DX1.1]WJE82676.1 peptidylprolyl isomerase PrsA [Bacillus sp. DX3.1]